MDVIAKPINSLKLYFVSYLCIFPPTENSVSTNLTEDLKKIMSALLVCPKTKHLNQNVFLRDINAIPGLNLVVTRASLGEERHVPHFCFLTKVRFWKILVSNRKRM